MSQLPSPADLQTSHPLCVHQKNFLTFAREKATHILERRDQRLACIVGPCSIHDCKAALDYAKRFKRLAQEIERSFFLVMRLFCEKPRTKTGWKGMLYDPDLDGSHDLAKGLTKNRELLLALAELEIPCAAEFLDPLAAMYYQDLITWGFIGARTSASQPHRQMASSFSFPTGFKNSIFGELDPALHGILTARSPHTFFGIDQTGHIATQESKGNSLTHLVLRGSESHPNFDEAFVSDAMRALIQHGLQPHLMIDCSHGNSKKDHRRQKTVFESVLNQVKQGNSSIAGLMLESHLYPGNQPHGENLNALHYGLSITDSCIGWEETEELLLWADAELSLMSIN